MLCYAMLQSCPTLCDPIDGSLPGSPVPGILQARTLEWVAISLSNAWKWKVKVKSLSRVRLLVTPWTAGYQAPPSMGFSRQEYWSGVPLPSPSNCLEHKKRECPGLYYWRSQEKLHIYFYMNLVFLKIKDNSLSPVGKKLASRALFTFQHKTRSNL